MLLLLDRGGDIKTHTYTHTHTHTHTIGNTHKDRNTRTHIQAKRKTHPYTLLQPLANIKVCLLFNEAQKKKTENMSLGGKKK